MKFTETNSPPFKILHLLEDIDAINAVEFEKMIRSCVAEEGVLLILDFSKVRFIDSSGISVIAKHFRTLQEKHGKMGIAGCNEALQRILKIVGFHRFFSILPTVEDVMKEMA